MANFMNISYHPLFSPTSPGRGGSGIRFALLLFAAFWLASFPAAASGGEDAMRRPSRPRSGALARLDSLCRKLEGTDPAGIHEAIEGMTRIRHPRSVERLESFLRSGQPDELTDHALEALGQIGLPDAIEVLAEFTRHRRPEARKKAYLSLSGIADRSVASLLATGLRDADPLVRGATALALGKIGARRMLEELFRAFELGVADAAVAIGQLADDTDARRFNSYLGKKSLPVMLSGYEKLLGRRDVTGKTKLAAVAALGELASQLFSGAQAEPAPGSRNRGGPPATEDTRATDASGRPAEPGAKEKPAADSPRRKTGGDPLPGGQIKRFLESYLASGGASDSEELKHFVRATILRIVERHGREAGD
jgi:hypothetical protein